MIRYRQEHCGMVLILLLVRYLFLLTKIIGSGSVPAAWKLAEICPIFKKDDPYDKSNYRPESILVTLDKVLRSALHANSLIILHRSCHRSSLRMDGVTAVRRYFYV